MPLPPDAILAHLKTNHAPYWSRLGMSAKYLSQLLGIDLSDSQCTRTLQGRAPRSVREKLAKAEVLSALSIAIDIEGLFACETLRAVDDLVPAFDDGQVASDRESSGVMELSASDIDPASFAFCTNELGAIKSLIIGIKGDASGRGIPNEHSLLVWPSEIVTGRSFLACAAAADLVRKGDISRAFIVHPFPRPRSVSVPQMDDAQRAKAFGGSLVELARRLKLNRPPRIAPLILRELLRTKSVLFLLNADCLIESSNSYNAMADLLHLAARHRRTGGPCPLVLIGEARPRSAYQGYVKETHAPHERLSIRVSDRFSFFQSQWRRFSALRGHDVSDDVGARLKRGRWYYNEWVKNSEVFPANIRLRAFFASNHDMQSYFDPTAGWSRLAGMEVEQLPEDIRLHLEDILYQLAELPKGKRQSQLRAARWCSTAIYWLTEEAAEDLGRSPPKTGLATFRSAVAQISKIVRQVPLPPPSGEVPPLTESEPPQVYRSGLAVKAVIQQDWLQSSLLERSRAHHRVASRLYDMQDNKDLLNVEFPLEPHWGRSRFHFLAECLRHLVRTCEHVDRRKARQYALEARPTSFPQAPSPALEGCQPTDVINFCFWELFCRQLNGNSGVGNILNRNLALRHGAYQLTLELLQLMSEGNRLGEPHWALHPDHRPLYFREVAYAQLDLGDLPAAKENFLKLIEISRERKQLLDLVVYQLDLVLALTTQDDLEGASEALKQAEATLQSHESPIKVCEENLEARDEKADEKRGIERRITPDRAQIKRLERRIASRRVHILYLRNQLNDTLAVYRDSNIFPESSVVRELAHIKIATLGRLGSNANLDEAMQVCISNIFQCTSKGIHHDALGFRIALGHLFRRKGMIEVAETMMDQVYNDILQYGCSERTYLSFLLEAGRTVLVQGRYARAYGGYLRPCADRARSRGYARCARTAREKAFIALEKIVQQRRDFAGKDSVWKQALRHELQARGEFAMRSNLSLDPLFSFDLSAMEQWVQRLGSAEALQLEMRALIAARN